MQITKLIQNHTYSGLILVFLFTAITVFVNNPDSNLEKRVTDLENRVDSIEETLSETDTNDASDNGVQYHENKAQSLRNWRQLKTGMSYDDVRKLLGEPDEINGGNIASWHYPNDGRVMFFLGDVDSWYEPEL